MTINIPREFNAGDTLAFTETESGYPASDGWTLHYGMFNAAHAFTLDATADGDDHAFSEAAATTAAWVDGGYDWTRYVTHSDGRKTSLSSGRIKILPDLSVPRDGRSHARKMLEAIESLIEDRATRDDLDLLRGQFKEREIERDRGALLVAYEKYKTEVASEDRADALARGERLPRNIKARFVR